MSRIDYPPEWDFSSRNDLDNMFVKAKAKGLWFFHGGLSGPLWFSPAELQAQQEGGKFVWGAVNWGLRKPTEHLDELDADIAKLMQERKNFEKRMINK